MEKCKLHVELEHNLGIFSPIGENLIKVKDGFQEAVEKEVRSERMKTELISNVSHDLKTPLTSIINYVDLLKNTELDKETRQSYIKILESKSKRLQILIEDLFEASKTASGNISLEIQEIDIIALMNQILGELKDKIEKSELNFKTNFPENKVLAHLDGRRTVRVIENLIGNSIKYALPHSRVFIDVIESEESVAITIKNISA
ncbi:MAG: histidine kinase dimerization/phospho-acceptor domain-containing protein, partial [Anaerorhabdus sp.]